MGGRDHACPGCGNGGLNNDLACECDERDRDYLARRLDEVVEERDGFRAEVLDMRRAFNMRANAAEREVERKQEELAAWLQRAEVAEEQLADCEKRAAAWKAVEGALVTRAEAAEREVERLEWGSKQLEQQRDATEAENDKLREALREAKGRLDDYLANPAADVGQVVKARAALAEPEEGEE